jgi:enoyl-CoA hydratase/carnithine racemase
MMRSPSASSVVVGLPELRGDFDWPARAFCAGGDLIEFETALKAGGTRLIDTLRYNQDVIQMVEELPVPVIGAANGTAVAGGLELLLACDMIIAAEHAKMGDGHAKFGVVPAGGATVRLVERIDPSRAAQLFYTASLVDAETLKDWGLVNEVVPREQLMERAMQIAREICRRSPEAIRHIKALIRRADAGGTRAAASERNSRGSRNISTVPIWQRATAFRNKQDPGF